MTAETLRKAAALMRERAQAASRPLPCWQALIGDSWDGSNAVTEGLGHPIAFLGEGPKAESDCRHIASWHPTVALAVADWLDYMAVGWREPFLAAGAHWGDQDCALAVARAYLGESE